MPVEQVFIRLVNYTVKVTFGKALAGLSACLCGKPGAGDPRLHHVLVLLRCSAAGTDRCHQFSVTVNRHRALTHYEVTALDHSERKKDGIARAMRQFSAAHAHARRSHRLAA